MSFRGPSRPGSRQLLRALYLSLTITGVVVYGSESPSIEPNGQVRTYPGESISWTPCGETRKGNELECSDINVPMDQFAPKNQTSDMVFNIPLVRLRREKAKTNLLWNPGGPGDGGLEDVFEAGDELSVMVGPDYHILSFDPRGVGSSLPAARCAPVGEVEKLEPGPAQLRDPDSFASTTNLVRACAESMGEHGKYINSPQTAADMNSILDAVGQEKMVFWGVSYGTLLGQTYAALFPNRSSRVVIDSNIHLLDWYQSKVISGDFAYTQQVFDGFIDECFKAPRHRCALSSHAKSKDELRDKVVGFVDKLGPEPMSVYVNSTYHGIINNETVWDGIFDALYDPSVWPAVASTMAQMMDGNGTEALLQWGSSHDKNATENADELPNLIITLNDGPSGPEQWSQGLDDLVDELSPYEEQFAPWFQGNHQLYYIRQQWAIPRTHPFHQPGQGTKTAYPLLILQNRFDPICPLVGGQAASETFHDSRLVEVNGYGHGATQYMCAVNHLQSYLRNGTLPRNGTVCQPDKPYFLPDDDDDDDDDDDAEKIKVDVEGAGQSSDKADIIAAMDHLKKRIAHKAKKRIYGRRR
ncbi:hypothetical protein XA68_13543 [Ophiocordyceps unilateralis]|uniref:Uncharacterized protein n=1 Tax=Ophiocordyceps unilateralis TaxID=268505 RepID=A0A2A9PCA1_OPHUN|nr:hypothetical protein XA68_13543 [Ophiocordyceps unilateralis]